MLSLLEANENKLRFLIYILKQIFYDCYLLFSIFFSNAESLGNKSERWKNKHFRTSQGEQTRNPDRLSLRALNRTKMLGPNGIVHTKPK